MLSQKNKIRFAAASILIIAILAVFLDFPEFIEKSGIDLPDFFNLPFLLGLDLQGGTHLIYEANVSEIPGADQASAVEGVRDVIERRVNAFGVAEPIVQTTKTGESWRIIAELAGVHDVNQAIKMIGETPLLEFKEPNPNPQVELTEDQKKELDDFNSEAKSQAEKILVQALKTGANFQTLALKYTQDSGDNGMGGDLGFLTRGQLVPEFEIVCFDKLKVGEIYKELVQTQFGYHIIRKEGEKAHPEDEGYEARCQHILIKTKSPQDFFEAADQWVYTGLTGKQLTRARIEFDPETQIPQIALEFNDEGKDLFAAITRRNIGKPVAIFLDGTPISIPTVQEEIPSGRAVISGNFKIQEAKLLAQRLNAGALPVPINLISQQTIGASLGNESMAKSLKAGLVGLLFVSLFMILFYRLPGVSAVLALIFYALAILAIFKLIPVTLSLAGIAGFILSLGMAFDANILVFERMKEELRQEKPLQIALEEGFKRAWPSIFDGNVSTLITCVILIGFTTSVVKGFAITLSIGVLVSMFSSMIVTKIILKNLSKIQSLNHLWLFGVKKKNIN